MGKSIDGERTQYTTRLSTAMLNEVREIALATGASTSATLALLVSFGLKLYKGEIIAVTKPEADHVLPCSSPQP